MLTSYQYQKVFPKFNIEWTDDFNQLLNKYRIDINNHRLSMFLAQIFIESEGLTRTEEDLNYRAETLIRLFPTHFDERTAAEYQFKPVSIANRIYANRMGNGSEASGDGWKYRGRGFIQLTGKEMIRRCSLGIFNDASLFDKLDWLKTMPGCLESALWYWNDRNCSTTADSGNIESNTRQINGGLIGIQDRTAEYSRILSLKLI